MTSIEENPAAGAAAEALPPAPEPEPTAAVSSTSAGDETPSVTEEAVASDVAGNGTIAVAASASPGASKLKRSRGSETAKPPSAETEAPLGKRVRKPNTMFSGDWFQQEAQQKQNLKTSKSSLLPTSASSSPSVGGENVLAPVSSSSTPVDTGSNIITPATVPGTAAEPNALTAAPPTVLVLDKSGKEVLMTPDKAKELNRKLPKGYAYVPEVEVLNPPAALAAQPVSGKRERKKINYAEVTKAKEDAIAAGAASLTTSTENVAAAVAAASKPKRSAKERADARKAKAEKKKAKKNAKRALQRELQKERHQRKKELQQQLNQLDTQLQHLSELEREIEYQGGPLPKEELKTKKRRNSKDDFDSSSKKRKKRSPSPSPIPGSRPQRTQKKRSQPYELTGLMKDCMKALTQLMDHQYAWPFNQPVDPVALNIPDYFSIIKHPMDLGTIKTRLAEGYYADPEELHTDVRLVWSNAQTYNPPGSDIYIMSQRLSDFFESKFKRIAEKQKKEAQREREKAKAKALAQQHHTHAPKTTQHTPILPSVAAASFVGLDLINELKRSVDAVREEIRQFKETKRAPPPPPKRPVVKAKFDENRPMTKEEKRALSIAINELASQHLGMVVQIIHQRMPALAKNAASDEIEIDIDNLDTPTLRHLENYVKTCNQPQLPRAPRAPSRKSVAAQALLPPTPNRAQQVEQAETGTVKRIEQVEQRLKEIQRQSQQFSKLVKSAGGFGRKNDDEDVVIDDEEPGKSSYPPVVIEKDKAAESSSDDSSDESDSSSDSDSSDSSDTDSDSDSSSETESEPEKRAKKKETAKSENAPTAAPKRAPVAPSPAPVVQAKAPAISAPAPKAADSSEEKVVFKIEPMQLELGSPPVVAPETVTSPLVPAAQNAESKKEVKVNADAWANLDEEEDAGKKSGETVALWSEFKSKDEWLKQKEREREEQQERVRRELQAQEERRRQEEEQKKREEEEAAAERLRQEKEAELQARKEREARRLAERLEREKRAGSVVVTSINEQTEIMAAFEQQVSKTTVIDILNRSTAATEASNAAPSLDEEPSYPATF